MDRPLVAYLNLETHAPAANHSRCRAALGPSQVQGARCISNGLRYETELFNGTTAGDQSVPLIFTSSNDI
jgi:hypothetical protein